MSCIPPHLLQRATILYRATELFVVSGSASCMPSFNCMAARIVRCFGQSVKDKERGWIKKGAILTTHQSQTNSKIGSASLSPGRLPNNVAFLTTQTFLTSPQSQITAEALSRRVNGCSRRFANRQLSEVRWAGVYPTCFR